MPKTVNLRINPNFLRQFAKPTASQEKAYAAAKDLASRLPRSLMNVDLTTATENIARSEGIYEIVPEEPSTPVPSDATVRLEDMPNDELLLLSYRLGATPTGKKVPRQKLVEYVRRKLSDMEVEGDFSEEVEDTGPPASEGTE